MPIAPRAKIHPPADHVPDEAAPSADRGRAGGGTRPHADAVPAASAPRRADAKPDVAVEPVDEAESNFDAEPVSEDESEFDAEPVAEDEPNFDAETVAEDESDFDAEPVAEDESDFDAETESNFDAEPIAEDESNFDAEPIAEDEPDFDAETVAETESDFDAEPIAEAEPDFAAEPVAYAASTVDSVPAADEHAADAHAAGHVSFFVTGTDTEIGKTLISAALLTGFARAGLRAAAMKPVAAGAAQDGDGVWCNDDVERLSAAASVAAPPELITPYLLREPTAPHLAAADEGVTIDLAHIVDCHAQIAAAADVVIVEGVGGFRVPLDGAHGICDTADLAVALNLPVILVVGLRLGCLNHALLTAEAIAARGLTLAGWVANHVDLTMRHAQRNVDTLQRRFAAAYGAPLLGSVPFVSPATPSAALAHLDLEPLVSLMKEAS